MALFCFCFHQQSIHGIIRDHWAALGWERGVLGYPITDETGTPDGVGRFNHFSNNGSIYWTPTTGAHEVHGLIRSRWASLGWERGCLGYPISDTTSIAAGEQNAFQHGVLSFDATTAQVTSSC